MIRYPVPYNLGGIYLDLDVKCLKPLYFSLTVDWISSPGHPIGLDIAFRAVAPGHPFLKPTIKNIKRFDLSWYSLYNTGMYALSWLSSNGQCRLNQSPVGSPLVSLYFRYAHNIPPPL